MNPYSIQEVCLFENNWTTDSKSRRLQYELPFYIVAPVSEDSDDSKTEIDEDVDDEEEKKPKKGGGLVIKLTPLSRKEKSKKKVSLILINYLGDNK